MERIHDTPENSSEHQPGSGLWRLVSPEVDAPAWHSLQVDALLRQGYSESYIAKKLGAADHSLSQQSLEELVERLDSEQKSPRKTLMIYDDIRLGMKGIARLRSETHSDQLRYMPQSSLRAMGAKLCDIAGVSSGTAVFDAYYVEPDLHRSRRLLFNEGVSSAALIHGTDFRDIAVHANERDAALIQVLEGDERFIETGLDVAGEASTVRYIAPHLGEDIRHNI